MMQVAHVHVPIGEVMKLSDRYFRFVRVTKNDAGKRVDWVGYFGGLEGPLAEGFAFQSVHKAGRPVIDTVNNGYCVRLYTDCITYTELDYFYWSRRADQVEQFVRSPDQVVLPCIPYDSVRNCHLYRDPEFATIKRRRALLTPAVLAGKTTIQLSFSD